MHGYTGVNKNANSVVLATHACIWEEHHYISDKVTSRRKHESKKEGRNLGLSNFIESRHKYTGHTICISYTYRNLRHKIIWCKLMHPPVCTSGELLHCAPPGWVLDLISTANQRIHIVVKDPTYMHKWCNVCCSNVHLTLLSTLRACSPEEWQPIDQLWGHSHRDITSPLWGLQHTWWHLECWKRCTPHSQTGKSSVKIWIPFGWSCQQSQMVVCISML